MASRKGMNISENQVVSINATGMPFHIYSMYFG